MDATFQSRFRIAIVTTRELGLRAGRPSILHNIILALERRHTVKVFRLRTVTEIGSLAQITGAMSTWIWSLVRGRPLPLQCVLYAAPEECTRVAAEIRDGAFDAVYLDTVRCVVLLRHLLRVRPRLHIVTDFDDLMSRRAEHLAQNRLPLLAGHVAPFLPRWLRMLVEKPMARLITRYEAATLVQSEHEAVSHSDAVVLLSAVERQALRARLPHKHRAHIYAIPPAIDVRATPWSNAETLRFVFIGSDEFLQNRRAIDCLIEKWRTLHPMTPLHIYGRQKRRIDGVSGVHWHGFVPDLADVYRPGSISLVPAMVAGGIKTKVAEAWAWGCPVLGNDQAFEGFPIARYPLILPEQQWDPLLIGPGIYRELWAKAARLGQKFTRRNLSMEAFKDAWEMVMQPAGARTAALFGNAAADVEAD